MEHWNAREQLEAAATWLGFQHEDLSFGLKTPEDGLKLWRYWRANERGTSCPSSATSSKMPTTTPS